jgi:hypothetical protein
VHVGVGYLRHTNPDQSIPEVLDYDPVAGLGLTGALFGKGFPRLSGMSSATGGGMSLPVGANGGPIFADKPTAVLSGTYVRGSHTSKAGGEWRIDTLTTRSISGQFGAWGFSPAQTGLPSTQTQVLSGGSVGLPYASFLLGLVDNANISNPRDPQSRKPTFSLFVQDNWKLTRKLTLDYGLRWDHQSYPGEIHRRTSMFSPVVVNPAAGGLLGGTAYEGDGPGRCNCRFAETYMFALGPRLGFAYQITPKTILRGGWGISYAQTSGGQADIQGSLGAGGWNTVNYNTQVFGDAAVNLRDGLKYNVVELYRDSTNPGIRPSPGQIDVPPSLIDPNGARPPRMAQWNLSLQREISTNLVMEAAYVGNRGAWFTANNLVNYNAITPERLRAFGLDINSAADQTLLRSSLNSALAATRGFNRLPYAGYPAASSVAQSLRPFPQFGNLTTVGAPLGNTWYDSLQVKLTKRLSYGLDLLGTFTWQKELTTIVPVNDVFNRRNQKGISDQSEPFIFVLAFNYRVPAMGMNKWMKAAIAGWTVGGIMRYASGLPIPVPTSQNQLATLLFQNTRFNRVAGEPLYLKDLNCHCFDPNKEFVLNPKAWADPASGQWGFSAPYYNDFRYQRRPDEQLTFGRVFRLRERMSFQIRAEFFNAFNRTYMNDPSAVNPLQTQTLNPRTGAPASGFGRIDTGSLVTQPRNGQIVARFQF